MYVTVQFLYEYYMLNNCLIANIEFVDLKKLKNIVIIKVCFQFITCLFK